jgi:hypothetical protein
LNDVEPPEGETMTKAHAPRGAAQWSCP